VFCSGGLLLRMMVTIEANRGLYTHIDTRDETCVTGVRLNGTRCTLISTVVAAVGGVHARHP
jgi:hypothetical protein